MSEYLQRNTESPEQTVNSKNKRERRNAAPENFYKKNKIISLLYKIIRFWLAPMIQARPGIPVLLQDLPDRRKKSLLPHCKDGSRAN